MLKLATRSTLHIWVATVVILGSAAAMEIPTPAKLLCLVLALALCIVGPRETSIAVVFAALPVWMIEIHLRGSIFGPLELALLACAAATTRWIVTDLLRNSPKETVRRWMPPLDITILAILLVVLGVASLLWVADPDLRPDSIRALRRVIVEPIFLIPLLAFDTRNGDRQKAMPWLGIPAIVVSLLAIVQFGLGRSTVQIGGFGRPIGTFTHPNNLSFYLERAVWFVPIAFALSSPQARKVMVGLTSIVVIALALTFSRGAAIGLIAGGLVYFHDRVRLYWKQVAAAGVALMVVAFGARYLASSGSSVDARERIWRSAIDMLRDHPWSGVGLDQFLGQYGRRYVSREGWPERYTSHPHNLILDSWLSLGVAGLIWLWALLERTWSRLSGLLRFGGDDISRAAIAMLIAGLAHGMVDNGFFLPDLATWTWIGLVLATPLLARRAE